MALVLIPIIMILSTLWVLIGVNYARSDVDRMVKRAYDKYPVDPGYRGVLTAHTAQNSCIQRQFVFTVLTWPGYWVLNRLLSDVISRADRHELRLDDWGDRTKARELMAQNVAEDRELALRDAFPSYEAARRVDDELKDKFRQLDLMNKQIRDLQGELTQTRAHAKSMRKVTGNDYDRVMIQTGDGREISVRKDPLPPVN